MNKDSQLDSLLKQMADDHQRQLPSPGLIWWRAQILRKQREKACIERPVRIMRMVASVAGLVVLTALVSASGQQLRTLLADDKWLMAAFGLTMLTVLIVWVSVLRLSARQR